MEQIELYLDELLHQKNKLYTILIEKEIEVEEIEKYNSLIEKTKQLSGASNTIPTIANIVGKTAPLGGIGSFLISKYKEVHI